MKYSDKISHLAVTYVFSDWIHLFVGIDWLSAVIATLIGVAYEFYQKETGTGKFEIYDMVADGAGAGLWFVRGLI